MISFATLIAFTTLALSACAAPADSSALNAHSPRAQLPFIGCYQDKSSSRLLNEKKTSSSDMTVFKCISSCAMSGYPVAGLEYGRECYCDYALQGAAIPAPQSECNQRCAGSLFGLQTCGAPDRLEVYSTSILPPENKARVEGFKYEGCYTDKVSSRALAEGAAGEYSDKMTVETCVKACKGRGKSFAGLEYSRECWCGDEIESAATKAPEEECHKTCTGDRREFCGGPDRITIYRSA